MSSTTSNLTYKATPASFTVYVTVRDAAGASVTRSMYVVVSSEYSCY